MSRCIFGIFMLMLITSCQKEDSFPTTPSIEFKEFITYNKDSADCTISFKDGDGDIGVLRTDTTKYNFKMKYLYKNIAGNFVPYDADPGTLVFDTLFYAFRIKTITPDGQYKALEGDLTAQLRATPIFNPKHSIVKFTIILLDRAGNSSNMVTTNEIVVPK